jgi:hypothetical protein
MVTKNKAPEDWRTPGRYRETRRGGGLKAGPAFRALRLITAFHAFLRFIGGGAKTARCKAQNVFCTRLVPANSALSALFRLFFGEAKSAGQSLACGSGRSLQALARLSVGSARVSDRFCKAMQGCASVCKPWQGYLEFSRKACASGRAP